MEKFIKKTLLGLAVIIAGAVAILPLSTQVANADTSTVTLTVNPVLSYSTDVSSLNFGTIVPGDYSTKNFTVSVQSNKKHTVQITSTSLTNGSGVTIPSGTNIASGGNAYGYKFSTDGSYTSAANTLQKTSGSYINSTQSYTVNVGVAIGKTYANKANASLASTITVTVSLESSNA